jgi:methyl acetate hydrolase
MKHSIDVLLGRAVSAGEVPGVAAMVTSRDKMLYAGAFGKRMLGGDAPMDLDTVCWLASLTKGLVAVGAMQLVERGVLDLNQPVQRWLPELGQARVLEGFDEEGRPRLRVPKHHITLVHLLTHTAGFGYEIWNAEIMKYQQATGTPGTGSGMNALLGTPLLFEPGARWNYGINLDWTGKLIEAVSGQTLGTYLAKNVFAPLGMDSTGF